MSRQSRCAGRTSNTAAFAVLAGFPVIADVDASRVHFLSDTVTSLLPSAGKAMLLIRERVAA